MKRIGTLAICAALLCATQAEAQTYQNRNDQNLSVRSGGVGESSRGHMEDSQKNYSFKAVFTGEKGIFLSDVDVRILNRRGREVLNNNSDGPMLLARLAPGRYVLHARAEGYERTQKFTVARRGLKTVYIRFPIRDENNREYGRNPAEQNQRWNNGNENGGFYPHR